MNKKSVARSGGTFARKPPTGPTGCNAHNFNVVIHCAKVFFFNSSLQKYNLFSN